ncbi:GNAT family N-acetyltransferase [Colwellia sp. MB02u-14]|uniref:GNAT family N-acetyltransferase n=1 Tax=Colwellia sp. MB02u-14 TaxID=2759815 RepID=UPI0015F49735|nr:GNAT family N-acetyltransferase [Colwellia sp. MB02u-14]MBA6304924.1 GNAT family N-acetyltransferase [Colwellia sp. MB02u-14]
MYFKDNYYISDDRDKVQFDEVKSLLKQSYWANNRDIETIQTSINNSICFSLFHNKRQVGFGRVVTDFASVAYISDVIIDVEHRNEGLGKWLVDTIVNDPRWKRKFQLLVTDDAHSLYEQFGFSSSHKLMSTPL